MKYTVLAGDFTLFPQEELVTVGTFCFRETAWTDWPLFVHCQAVSWLIWSHCRRNIDVSVLSQRQHARAQHAQSWRSTNVLIWDSVTHSNAFVQLHNSLSHTYRHRADLWYWAVCWCVFSAFSHRLPGPVFPVGLFPKPFSLLSEESMSKIHCLFWILSFWSLNMLVQLQYVILYEIWIL